MNDLTEILERYSGPIKSWMFNMVTWFVGDLSPIAALGAIAALGWTLERWRRERQSRLREARLEGHLVQTLDALTRPFEDSSIIAPPTKPPQQ